VLGEKVDEEERRREVSICSLSRGPKCVIELLALCKRERDVDNLNNTKKGDSSKKEEKRHKLNTVTPTYDDIIGVLGMSLARSTAVFAF
jgi:hypothetical protein